MLADFNYYNMPFTKKSPSKLYFFTYFVINERKGGLKMDGAGVGGYGGGFALIVVLFILLIIIGASFMGGGYGVGGFY